MTRQRRWWVRLGLAAAVVLAGVGIAAVVFSTEWTAGYYAWRVRRAGDEATRAAAADRLARLGPAGQARLLRLLGADAPECRATAAAAIERSLAACSDDDPLVAHWLAALSESFPGLPAEGQQAVLRVLPTLLKKRTPETAGPCRAVVAAGLRSADPGVRVAAARLALHPVVHLQPEVLPLLSAPEPQVRQAALFVAAVTGPGEPLLADEDLFRWLHDPDEGVRRVCYEVLVGRDRTAAEIELGRRLTAPDPQERLRLLPDLRYDGEVPDPEPWLERLGRDPEPAVRAGAARVMAEVAAERRLPRPAWVDRVAEADDHPTVRRVARFFRDRPTGPPLVSGGP